MKRIRCYEVSDDIFDKILYRFQHYVKLVPSTNPYIHGYEHKDDIYYDGSEYMILRECILNYFCHNIRNCTDWKQCRIRRVENMECKVEDSTDGQSAWEFMISLLEHYYTWEGIVERFNMFTKDYDESYKQYHYQYPTDSKNIFRFDNCFKYDINGAHTDALIEIFPRAKSSIMKMYRERKKHPVNKDVINFFVGMIKHKGYEKTYNWIVQRTTNSLFKAMDFTSGIIIYANTDGFVTSSPKAHLEASKELGKYKLEYSGTVYVYGDKNYWIMQTGDELKGSCLKSVRKKIDLRIGQVVHYERKRLKLFEGQYINVADNVTIEDLSKENLWDE